MRSISVRGAVPGAFFLACLSKIVEVRRGHLTIVAPDNAARSLVGADPGQPCRIQIRSWYGFLSALPFGSAAVGRAYAAGHFDVDDLTALAQLDVVPSKRLLLALGTVRKAVRKLQCWRRTRFKNTLAGAKRNIQAHYDIGNNFYRLWLDPGMTYSAALFAEQERDLETAQAAKYARALNTLRLPSGRHILEIGCGWGGFAEYAGRAGFAVTAITLSEAQFAFARRRIENAGLAGQVKIELMDYRDLEGAFDGVVSIEMIEAVGETYWPTFFAKLAESLRPGGRALLQSTTVPDERFEAYRTGTDFIREEIFPGGMLISPRRLRSEATAAGLMLADVMTFGQDYAKTLKLWCDAIDRETPAIRRLGFDDRFVRAWRLYLLGCQGAFEAGDVDVGQFCFERPLAA